MQIRVLLVDDEKDFLEIMAERMRARGIEVWTTTSAENALKLVEKNAFAAVIMDLLMPEMDGFKALKLLKASKPEVQIIFLTGNVPAEKCVEAIRLGALDVIEKPADIEALIKIIKNLKAPEITP
jgi:two-component system response regulator RegA